eukprot:2574275-Amphidinium_carterae.1
MLFLTQGVTKCTEKKSSGVLTQWTEQENLNMSAHTLLPFVLLAGSMGLHVIHRAHRRAIVREKRKKPVGMK